MLLAVFAPAFLLGSMVRADQATQDLAEATTSPPVVVELFTSQGCSSCPPADAFLGDLAGRDDVLALSFHVDYWDYIGWKDPFADGRHGDRQRRYAKNFDLRYVYTPQMVIQGAFQVTGSDRRAVEKAIITAKDLPKVAVTLSRMEQGDIAAQIRGTETQERAKIWAIIFDKSHSTEIKRGENRGKTLTYSHVVRDMVDLGDWTGMAQNITITKGIINWAGHDGLALMIQSETSGQVLGTGLIMPHQVAAIRTK